MNPNPAQKLALVLIKTYQVTLSPLLGGNCRFQPSCSHYAIQCFQEINFTSALKLVTKRVLKCHPFGARGFDPVPSKTREGK